MSSVKQQVSSNRKFCEQIGDALTELGSAEAMACMARAMIMVAHRAGNDMEFKCDAGKVGIERIEIPHSSKN